MGEPPAEPQQIFLPLNQEQFDIVEILFMHVYQRLPHQVQNFLQKSSTLIEQNRKVQTLNTFQVMSQILRYFVNTGCGSWLIGIEDHSKFKLLFLISGFMTCFS
jgi:hypothetical protein